MTTEAGEEGQGGVIQILTTDLVAVTRGRSVAAAERSRWMESGIGWVPANIALTPFGAIAIPNRFDCMGDVRVLPDAATEVRVSVSSARPTLHFLLGDLVELDGSPWVCCPRNFLRRAIEDLARETGLRIVAAFEHEFGVVGLSSHDAPTFSLSAHRRAEPLLSTIFAALHEAGAEPETILPEYGRDQFEVSCRPAEALAAADRAVVVREVVREIAGGSGVRASFSPKPRPEGIGNGVHIHFSLLDLAGAPAMFDPARDGQMSATAGAFAAGVLRHLAALCALAAPSPVSYLRLVPNHWCAAYGCLGAQNREAALRICPGTALGGCDPARAFNIEFRVADATANPYLVLAGLIRTGLEGLRAKLPTPPLVNINPESLGAGERARLGIARLPTSLSAALEALRQDEVACSWFDPLLLETYIAVKRNEIALAAPHPDEENCRRYEAVY